MSTPLKDKFGDAKRFRFIKKQAFDPFEIGEILFTVDDGSGAPEFDNGLGTKGYLTLSQVVAYGEDSPKAGEITMMEAAEDTVPFSHITADMQDSGMTITLSPKDNLNKVTLDGLSLIHI